MSKFGFCRDGLESIVVVVGGYQSHAGRVGGGSRYFWVGEGAGGERGGGDSASFAIALQYSHLFFFFFRIIRDGRRFLLLLLRIVYPIGE